MVAPVAAQKITRLERSAIVPRLKMLRKAPGAVASRRGGS